MLYRKSVLAGAATLAMGLSSLTGVAEARKAAPAFLPVGEEADAPSGFVDMCARDILLCHIGADASIMAMESTLRQPAGPDAEKADPVLATGAIPIVENVRNDDPRPIIVIGKPYDPPGSKAPKDLYRILKKVNAEVNRAIYPVTDRQAYGIDEVWQRPMGPRPVGDCEDFAIEKRYRLTAMGFPAARLFYAAVFHPTAGLHTVLIARLDDGDYILDNLSPHILHWSKVRFSWLRQQMPGRPEIWTRIPDWKTIPDLSGGAARAG